MTDPYYLDGTKVLRNRLGYTDRYALEQAESLISAARISELAAAPISGGFDFAHLRSIHRYILSDLYEWAGEVRVVDTQAGQLPVEHDAPERIPEEAARIFGELAEGDFLRGRGRDEFTRGLAEHWGDMTCLHPFRDGNSRTQRVFFDQLAREAGWAIDWRELSVPAIQAARNFAYFDGGLILTDVLDPLIKPAEQVPAEAILASPIHDPWTLNDHWHAMVDHANADTGDRYRGPHQDLENPARAERTAPTVATVDHATQDLELARTAEVHRQHERHAASRPQGMEGPRL